MNTQRNIIGKTGKTGKTKGPDEVLFIECSALGRRLEAIYNHGGVIIDLACGSDAAAADPHWKFAAVDADDIKKVRDLAKEVTKTHSSQIGLGKLTILRKSHGTTENLVTWLSSHRARLTSAIESCEEVISPLIAMHSAKLSKSK